MDGMGCVPALFPRATKWGAGCSRGPQPRCGWGGVGDGPQGLPRASANPGLGDATPLALGEGGVQTVRRSRWSWARLGRAVGVGIGIGIEGRLGSMTIAIPTPTPKGWVREASACSLQVYQG
jgi:hypothetical protein